MKKTLEELFANASPQDQRSASMIIRVLENNNIPGFDYLEFKQSLEGLAKMNMDEGTAFQSAFVTASTLGLTKTKLIQTADHYIKIVGQEKQKFDQAAQNQINKGIAAKRAEAKQLEKAMNDKYERIKKIKAEIDAHQQRLEKLRTELNGAEQKINAAKQSFENVYQEITSHIKCDIDKIQQYIT